MGSGARIGDVVLAAPYRFVIEAEAGTGGMAIVYRARDEVTGQLVALKLLFQNANRERFDREARLLASLDHPAIVRYVAHGEYERQLFLAMEWLEGEDLSRRLRRSRLTDLESVVLARRVADALVYAHGRDVVHRDLKPSNLFLVEEDLSKAKVLDFGVAYDAGELARVTQSGATIGTPGYMAPEQVRAEGAVGPSADLFSLGCVLFECLTRQPAYSGKHAMAILAKILLEPPPDPAELAPTIPLKLGDLVTKLLEKDAIDRPASAAIVEAELAGFEAEMRARRTDPPPIANVRPSRRGKLSSSDLELVCVVALGPARDRSVDSLVSAARLAAAYGTRLEVLANGAAVTTLRGSVATDLASRAATFSLAVRDAIEGVAAGIAIGRAELGGTLPLGESIDRAVQLMRRSAAEGGIHLDEITDGLLDERFERKRTAGHNILRAFRDTDTPRTLLGKRTPFVGREAELATLQSLVDQSADAPMARVALVAAPPGAGKSRLRREVVQWIRGKHAASSELRSALVPRFLPHEAPEASDPERAVWIARGDSIGAHAPYGLIARLLRDAIGVRASEPVDSYRMKIAARVAEHVEASERERVAEFLGEIAGVSLPPGQSARMDAARRDPIFMKDQVRRAWADFVEAEARVRPVVMILDDMQWADRPSFESLDAVLRQCHEAPVCVIGFGRVEVEEILSDVWRARALVRITLPPLGRRAAEKLVTSMLGPDTDGITVSTLVEQAGGNAFFLEELIRAAAEGHPNMLPDTVVAMAEARLATLPADVRRVLRAASVFGSVFWDAALRALLGDEPSGKEGKIDSGRSTGPGSSETSPGSNERRAKVRDLDRALMELVERELVSLSMRSRFPRVVEYAFRHSLVREAAYDTMTEEDRALGHALAGEWLTSVGCAEPLVLADHFERAGLPAQALPHIAKAAAFALDANDFDGAIRAAERGYGCGVTGDALGELLRIHAEALKWRGDTKAAEERGLLAIQRLSEGSDAWFAAAGEVVVTTLRLGRIDRLTDIVGLVKKAFMSSEAPSAPASIAAARAVAGLLHAGQLDLADELLLVLREKPHPTDPVARARLAQAEGTRALVEGDVLGYLERMVDAAAGYLEIGDLRMACNARVGLGYALGEVGELEEAREALTAALKDAEKIGSPQLAESARCNLGFTLARLGELAQAEHLLERAARTLATQGDRRTESAARAYLAWALCMAGDFDRADIEATRAIHAAPGDPARIRALGMSARVLLAAGRSAAALKASTEAATLLATLGGIDAGEAQVRVVHAECLAAADCMSEAKEVIRDAAERLRARAARIPDLERRARFFEGLEENRRTLELERRWG